MKNNYSSVATLDEAALLASDQTMLAYCQGTFSVGGVLIQCSTGEVIHALHNNVVVDGVTQDPTAHGERQLVDWYFEQVDGGATLPSPEDLMVVTSLDPCCMCTGSLASAGFKAVISANDEFAGINYDLSATFPSVTDPETLQNTFSYPAVSGATCFAREESGAPLPALFDGQSIDEHTQAINRALFDATLTSVQETISGDEPPDPDFNIATLSPDNPIVLGLKSIYPQALDYTLAVPGTPDSGLIPFIEAAQQEDIANGGNGDVAALIDAFGNLILCLPGQLAFSPILTPWMRVTREYQQLKHTMITTGVADARKYLLHPKYGVILFLRCPNDSFRDLVDLGAYGSTMEAEIPDMGWPNFQFIQPSTIADVQSYLDGLPPFYSTLVKVSLTQVTDTSLWDAFPIVPPPAG
ncbi:nucleoside deaminase [Sinorhizobium meliloti]|uniref:nucleoside deaminase n=1 Tax=Rhizobium meliloti TaxID=382 RepID=UPI00398C95C3